MFTPLKRHSCRLLAAAGIIASLPACLKSPRRVTLDLVLFNYLNRPIFDVSIDGKDSGVSSPYPKTGGGTISGVTLELGPKIVHWRLDGPEGMPRNGDRVNATNAPTLSSVPDGACFLAVHIYPDYTVELIPTVHYPQETDKGQEMQREYRRRGHPDTSPML